MKVSIALATYNGATYLQEQLDSYLTQERMPDEVIICDDTSSDNTIEILESFQNIAPFQVKIKKNKKNIGYTKNFEEALSLCSGDIVFLSDQDDIWYPDKIKTIEEIFTHSSDVSLLIHDGEIVDNELNFTGLTKLGQIRSGGYSDESFVTGTLSVIHKDILNIILPFPNGISGGHDGWIHNIADMAGRRKIITNVLQKLRRHSSNTSEWVASSTKRINKLHVIVSQFQSKTATTYADRLFYNECLSHRFNAIESGFIPYPYTLNYKAIQKKLEEEKVSLLKREQLLSENIIGKKISALSMLFKGDYKYFNGYRSFLRDFLR